VAKKPVCYNRAPFDGKSCSCSLSNFLVRIAVFGGVLSVDGGELPGGAMTFYDETLYGRDDEMDEFGDGGAYGESPEEIIEEEEEEEEEEAGVPVVRETVSVVEVEEPMAPAKPAGGGGGTRKPAKKAAKKKPAKKAAKKKPAKKAAKKKPAKKAAKKKKSAKKKGGRRR
jgi:hypothetical protein